MQLFLVLLDTGSAPCSPFQPCRCADVTHSQRIVSEFSYQFSVDLLYGILYDQGGRLIKLNHFKELVHIQENMNPIVEQNLGQVILFITKRKWRLSKNLKLLAIVLPKHLFITQKCNLKNKMKLEVFKYYCLYIIARERQETQNTNNQGTKQ